MAGLSSSPTNCSPIFRFSSVSCSRYTAGNGCASRCSIDRPTARRRRGNSSDRSAISCWARFGGDDAAHVSRPRNGLGARLHLGPLRRPEAAVLHHLPGILFFVWLVAALSDPRVRGFKPLSGGYEQDAINSLRQATQNIRKNIPELTGTEMNFSFFGQKWWPDGFLVGGHYIPGMTDIMSVLVILSALLLWRINPLWTLLVFSPSPSRWS